MLSTCAFQPPCLSSILCKLVNRKCIPKRVQLVPLPCAQSRLSPSAPTHGAHTLGLTLSGPSSTCQISPFWKLPEPLHSTNPNHSSPFHLRNSEVGRPIGQLRTMATGEASASASTGTESAQPKYTNRLAKEESPYLLQHAHNPGG
jgi:hypothetical protein